MNSPLYSIPGSTPAALSTANSAPAVAGGGAVVPAQADPAAGARSVGEVLAGTQVEAVLKACRVQEIRRAKSARAHAAGEAGGVHQNH